MLVWHAFYDYYHPNSVSHAVLLHGGLLMVNAMGSELNYGAICSLNYTHHPIRFVTRIISWIEENDSPCKVVFDILNEFANHKKSIICICGDLSQSTYFLSRCLYVTYCTLNLSALDRMVIYFRLCFVLHQKIWCSLWYSLMFLYFSTAWYKSLRNKIVSWYQMNNII